MINGHAGIFHPNFAYHPRPTVETSQQVKMNIYAPTGAVAEWVPGQGMSNVTQTLVWSGYGRVQPDKDWRARARMQGNEFDAVQAVRVQVAINRNYVGATYDIDGNITAFGPDPVFAKDFIVKVVELNVTGSEVMIGKPLVVRNALAAGTRWSHNLLCDAGAK